MPVTVPDRSPGSLGPALANTRAPTTNELSAVHVEEIKDLLIEFADGINAPDLEVATATDTAITVTSLDGLAGPLEIKPYGLSGVTDLAIQPSIVPSGVGKGTTVTGGQGATGSAGGSLSLDAGAPNGAGAGGNVRIGRDNAEAIFSGLEGVGSVWTHEGEIAAWVITADELAIGGGPATLGGEDLATTPYVNQPQARTVSGTTDTLAGGDIGGVVMYSQAGGVTVDLPTLAAYLIAGKVLILTLQATNAATVITVDPGASVTIDGSASDFVADTGKARVSLISVDGLAWFSGTP